MWQRVQTIFLALISITMLIFLFVPIWQEVTPEGLIINLTAFSLKQFTIEGTLASNTGFPYFFVGIAAILVVVLAIYEITRFDNRLTQLKIGALNSLLMAVVLLLSVWFMIEAERDINPAIQGSYQLGLFLPMLAMLFNVIANRYIRKDERLVRSVDRIR
ncbi:MAG: DUF4293 domain-containing protein [Cyclobacteriaceae bacterium]